MTRHPAVFMAAVMSVYMGYQEKVRKGARWMPWLTEAMKDVISCDKLRVGANNLRSGDFRMGEPSDWKSHYLFI